MSDETAQHEEFTIFWTIFGPDEPVLMPLQDGRMCQYALTEPTSWPIYISGKQLENFNQTGYGALEVDSLNMAAGALLGCKPPRPYLPVQGPLDVRPLLSDYLERYTKELGYVNLEDLIFEISGILRSRNGSVASAMALKNAEFLNVNFHKILNDLTLDLWAKLTLLEEEALPNAIRELNAYLSRVSIDKIHPESVAWYHYASSVSLLYLEVCENDTIIC